MTVLDSCRIQFCQEEQQQGGQRGAGPAGGWGGWAVSRGRALDDSRWFEEVSQRARDEGGCDVLCERVLLYAVLQPRLLDVWKEQPRWAAADVSWKRAWRAS